MQVVAVWVLVGSAGGPKPVAAAGMRLHMQPAYHMLQPSTALVKGACLHASHTNEHFSLVQLTAVWLPGGCVGGSKPAAAAGMGCSMHVTSRSIL